MNTKSLLTALFLSGALYLASACSTATSTSGIPPTSAAQDGGEAETGATSCPANLSGDCGACMKDSCCGALSACEADADCLACVTAQDGDACERTAETHARVDAYLTCKGGTCASRCISGDDAGSCQGTLNKLVKASCATCMEQACCSEVAACHQSTVCWDGCFTNHDETKCHGAPDAHALFHAMGACASSRCKAECAN